MQCRTSRTMARDSDPPSVEVYASTGMYTKQNIPVAIEATSTHGTMARAVRAAGAAATARAVHGTNSDAAVQESTHSPSHMHVDTTF